MEQHIQRYTKYIYEDLYTIDIDTATYKEHLHKSFEWFACIQLSKQYNSIFTRWEDVHPQIRENKCMTRDMGIDAWDMEGNRVAQMKLYQGRIEWGNFATFLGCCFKFKDVTKMLYRTRESTLCKLIESYVKDKTIVDTTIPGLEFRSECNKIQALTMPSPTLPEPFVIRHYQKESISYLEKGKDENKNVYLCIPTGCGKTLIILHYHIQHRNELLLVLVPRVVLMEQWGEECKKLGIKSYLIGTGQHHNLEQYKDETVVICVYDSFPNIYDQKDKFNRYCIDEVHHIKRPERYMDTEVDHHIENDDDDNEEDDVEEEEQPMSYMECIESLSDTKKAIYISATLDTPEDDSLFYEYKVRRAIEEGYLCDYQFVFPIFEEKNITNEHLAHYLVHKQHESHCVIYAPSCKEGQEFTQMLNNIRKGCAGYIDADTPYKERKRLFAEFESGQIQFLVNIRILVEGFNAPHIRSIFFLRVSTSEIFIIQAIGRALCQHQDKLIATIYVPFTHESDLERIQTFIGQLSTYDERIKKSIDENNIGGYINIECGEDIEDLDEKQQNYILDMFDCKYNLIVDSMGNSNMMEQIAIKKALEYKQFYNEKQRKPIQVLYRKEKRENATEEHKNENKLVLWFNNMKQAKKCIYNGSKLYPSVEKILIEVLGEKWYENDNLEEKSLKIALEYKEFYQQKQQKPSHVLNVKTKEQKKSATEEQKKEHKIALWFTNIKKGKKGTKIKKGKNGIMYNCSHKIYPSVEKILVEVLGEKWYENDDLEEKSLKIALEYKKFYNEKQRKPSQVLIGKLKENTSEEHEKEHKLAQWFIGIKKTKNLNKSHRYIIYPPVEKILVEVLGEKWFENDDLEEKSLKFALEYKQFYQEKQRKPSNVIGTKEKRENATEEQKKENKLALWFSNMKRAKNKKNKSILYSSVDKIFIEVFGEKWFEK